MPTPEPEHLNPTVAAAFASALASGVASNAFGVRDNGGVELSPEGVFTTFQGALESANMYARLAGYAMVDGGHKYKDLRKKYRKRK